MFLLWENGCRIGVDFICASSLGRLSKPNIEVTLEHLHFQANVQLFMGLPFCSGRPFYLQHALPDEDRS